MYVYVSEFTGNLCCIWEKMNNFYYCILFYTYKIGMYICYVFYYVTILFYYILFHLLVNKKCSILFRNIVYNFLKF